MSVIRLTLVTTLLLLASIGAAWLIATTVGREPTRTGSAPAAGNLTPVCPVDDPTTASEPLASSEGSKDQAQGSDAAPSSCR